MFHAISRVRTHAATFFLACLMGGSMPASAGGDMVDRFDASVAQGLPASLQLAGSALTIERRMNVRLRIPDQSQGTMFSGSLDGRHVTVTRWGDHLDITRQDSAGVTVERFGRDENERESLRVGEAAANPATETNHPAFPRRRRALPDAKRTQVDIHLFVHDDVAPHMTREQIHAGYVAWWLDDTTSFLPLAEIVVTYHPIIRGVTDMPYMHARALANWELVATQWATMEDYDESPLRKYLLVTLLGPDKNVSGLALQGRHVAMAAITGRYRVIAHELGHLFGAEHADGEIRYQGGWWCESNMYGTAMALRSNCYLYSAANQARIGRYLVHGPEADDTRRRGPEIID